MARRRRTNRWLVAFLLLPAAGRAAEDWAEPLAVTGGEVTTVTVTGAGQAVSSAFDDLARVPRAPGTYRVRFRAVARDGEVLAWPHCAGSKRLTIDGTDAPMQAGPTIVPLKPGVHIVEATFEVSSYERRIACGAPPRVGEPRPSREGYRRLRFASKQTGPDAGQAVVFIPPGHDERRPAAVLVGLHPWNGSPWTYAAYPELARAATEHDMVVLLPSGLGNSLYTAQAENEVMQALSALASRVTIDPDRVTLWGASMGGAGATTVGLHRPDRFALLVSLFGDAKYDRKTYVRTILTSDEAAHRVNAIDAVDNARHLPIWLVHGEGDRVSPIAQSDILARALAARGYAVQFDRVPKRGHEGGLVSQFLPDIVKRAALSRTPRRPSRITFRSVRPEDESVYGVTIVRDHPGDAFVDVERRDEGVHVLALENVQSLAFASDAFGLLRDEARPRVWFKQTSVPVRWLLPP